MNLHRHDSADGGCDTDREIRAQPAVWLGYAEELTRQAAAIRA